MTITFGVGVVGMSLILIGFILDEFVDSLDQDTIYYNVINLCGAGCLVYYAYSIVSWPFLVLNAVWFLVAGYKLVLLVKK